MKLPPPLLPQSTAGHSTQYRISALRHGREPTVPDKELMFRLREFDVFQSEKVGASPRNENRGGEGFMQPQLKARFSEQASF